MQSSTLWTSAIAAASSLGALAVALTVPAIRAAIGKYIAGFVQHHFDERIERLKSELRQSEDKFRAELRASEQTLKSLTETAFALRSNRQVALDTRRLQAVEKLWTAKIATDKWKMAAQLTSILNLEEVFKAAEKGDSRVKDFAAMLDKMTGLDLEKEAVPASAISERPFLPANVWTIFSAYQGVMLHSVMTLKILAAGATKYLKKEDTLKPQMLMALPEYENYIEKYGFSGYFNLLDILEQKLLHAITEMLDGKDVDSTTLKRSAEIIFEAREFGTEMSRKIPEELRGPEIPPPKTV